MSSLIQRKNGIYYAIYCDGTRRRWLSMHTRNLDEARTTNDSMIPFLEKPRRVRLSAFRQQLHDYCAANFAPGTTQIYSLAFSKLQKAIGDLPLRDIGPLHIERFKQERLKTVARVTVNINLRTLRAGFHLAVEWALIDKNPAKPCKLLRVPLKDPCYLSKAQFLTLCSITREIQFRRLLLLAALTGMRRGEIVNLHWDDMDFNQGLIRIKNRENFVVKGLRPRTIPMPAEILRAFEPSRKEAGFVFQGRNGTPLNPHSVSRRFKSYAKRCGLPKELHFHSLRHTYASWLVQAHVPIFQVQRLLGHQSISTTETYTHLRDEHLREAAQLLDLSEFSRLAG